MKGKKIPVLTLLVLLAGVFSFCIGIPLLRKYTPTKEMKDLNLYYNLSSEEQTAIIQNSSLSDTQAKRIDGAVYVSYTYVHEFLNQRIYWDSNEELLLYAADTQLIEFAPDTVYSDYSDAPAVIVSEGDAYINISVLKQFSDFIYGYYENPSRLVITNDWTEEEISYPKSKTELRTLGGIKCPIVRTVTASDKLIILSRDTKWTKVITDDGMIGYIRSRKLGQSSTETPVSEYMEETHEHILLDNTICLAWHQVSSSDANEGITDYLNTIKGVNVISPTWFCLSDTDGSIVSYASSDYVNACHEKGIQVWPTINDVDFPDVDVNAVLSHTSTRTTLINAVVSNALACGCDGINVDLERMTEAGSGTSYIEFIRELSIQCAAEGLILSVDNTKPYSFNSYYNRSEQANYADYLVFMGYDEHYSGSEDGSVSSLSWAEEGIADNLAQGVPSEQLILGNPFYTRLWEVTPKTGSSDSSASTESDKSTVNAESTESDESTVNAESTESDESTVNAESDESAPTEDRLATYDITSTVYSMTQAEKLLNTQHITASFDETSGQNYAQWTENDTTYEIWMEDSTSISERMQLMQDYQLGGVAFWRLGLETDDIWDLIDSYLD